MRKLVLLMGSAADYDLILKSVRSRRSRKWGTRITDLEPGDTVLLYLVKPYSQLFARAKVLERPKRGQPGDYRYRVKIGNFELLPNQLTIDNLRQRFPMWKAIQRLQGSQVVPTAYAQTLWKLVHDKSSGVQILISNADYGLRLINHQARTGAIQYWSVPKNTAQGDTVLFYVVAPEQKIAATGRVFSRTRQTRRKWYEAKIGEVRILKHPLALSDLRKKFQDWPWLRSVTMFSYINPVRAKQLLQLVGQRQSVGAPSEETNDYAGGGFSADREKNRRVQRAAERYVGNYYEKRGYTVTHMPQTHPGYDLQVLRNGSKLHIEVKGVSGNIPSFIITPTELKQARYRDWRLAIVTQALTSRCKLKPILTGKDFLNQFECSPLSYMAVPRLKK